MCSEDFCRPRLSAFSRFSPGAEVYTWHPAATQQLKGLAKTCRYFQLKALSNPSAFRSSMKTRLAYIRKLKIWDIRNMVRGGMWQWTLKFHRVTSSPGPCLAMLQRRWRERFGLRFKVAMRADRGRQPSDSAIAGMQVGGSVGTNSSIFLWTPLDPFRTLAVLWTGHPNTT